jgi:hypothetical protein
VKKLEVANLMLETNIKILRKDLNSWLDIIVKKRMIPTNPDGGRVIYINGGNN